MTEDDEFMDSLSSEQLLYLTQKVDALDTLGHEAILQWVYNISVCCQVLMLLKEVNEEKS